MTQLELFGDGEPRHSFVALLNGKSFLLFNEEPLSMETIGDADLSPVAIANHDGFDSAAWSCDAEWYFAIVPEGIVLCRVGANTGLLCRKKSARFIEHFITTI